MSLALGDPIEGRRLGIHHPGAGMPAGGGTVEAAEGIVVHLLEWAQLG